MCLWVEHAVCQTVFYFKLWSSRLFLLSLHQKLLNQQDENKMLFGIDLLSHCSAAGSENTKRLNLIFKSGEGTCWSSRFAMKFFLKSIVAFLFGPVLLAMNIAHWTIVRRLQWPTMKLPHWLAIRPGSQQRNKSHVTGTAWHSVHQHGRAHTVLCQITGSPQSDQRGWPAQRTYDRACDPIHSREWLLACQQRGSATVCIQRLPLFTELAPHTLSGCHCEAQKRALLQCGSLYRLWELDC